MEPKFELGQKVWINKYLNWMSSAKIEEIYIISYKSKAKVRTKIEYLLDDKVIYQENELIDEGGRNE